MSINELATSAKTNQALMPELWQGVQRLVRWWAARYTALGAAQGSRICDYDDYIQCGYLALADAI